MNILLLPNALKGSLSALEIIEIFKNNIPAHHKIKAYPISDGGDGFIDCFKTIFPESKIISISCKNAFGKNQNTCFLYLEKEKIAILETAKLCGIGNTPKERLSPLTASSYGVGQAIEKAREIGAKTIYIGLGGVATCDGGAGMLKACGAKFINKIGEEIKELTVLELLQTNKLDLSPLQTKYNDIKFYGIADVVTPLLGKNSSAKVFGPQKGTSATQVKIIDKAMAKFARLIKKSTGNLISKIPSTGAAGAIAAGLKGAFNAELLLGADFLFKQARLEKLFKWADIIITAEGKLDKQTFYGKAPLTVLKLAKKHKKQVLFICGQVEKLSFKILPSSFKVVALSDFASSTKDAIINAKKHLNNIIQLTF